MRKSGDDTLQKKQSIESMYNFLLFQNCIMKKTDIMIDVANIEQIQKIIRTAYETAEKFVRKSDSSNTIDEKMISEMKALMSLIENESEEKNKYIIEVSDDKTVTVQINWNFDRVMLSILKNVDAIKWIVWSICKKEEWYNLAIEMIQEERKKPLQWKILEW